MPFGLEIKNKTEGRGEVYIYGDITDEKWYDTDVTPKELKLEFDKLKNAKDVDIYINSGGGGVFAGMAIASMIKRLTANTTTYIDGLAASIATVIALASKKVVIPKNALFMVHNPMAGAFGYASDLKKVAEILDKVKDTIVSSYMEKTNQSEKQVRSLMDDETWLSGDEAVAFGFADELAPPLVIANSLSDRILLIGNVSHDISKFNKFDKGLVNIKQPKPVIEKVDYSLYENQLSYFNNLIQEVSL